MLIRSYTTYEIATFAAPVVAGGFILQLAPEINPTLPQRVMGLTRLIITLSTAVQTDFGLVAADTRGTPTVPGTFPGQQISMGNGGYSGGSGVGNLYTLWSAAPTLAVTPRYFRREILAGAIGERLVWEWPEDDPFGGYPFSLMGGGNSGVLVQNLNPVLPSALVLVSARWKDFSPG